MNISTDKTNNLTDVWINLDFDQIETRISEEKDHIPKSAE
jgi:hypothetical protein